MHPLVSVVIILLAFLLPSVSADTEIINFDAPRHHTTTHASSLPGKWRTISSQQPQIILTGVSAPQSTEIGEQTEIEECNPLSLSRSSGSSHLEQCPHEIWLVLNLDDGKNWSKYDRFTLRVSWPGSQPTKISLSLFDPESSFLHESTPSSSPSSSTGKASEQEKDKHTNLETPIRQAYARVKLTHIGVLTPHPPPFAPSPSLTHNSTSSHSRYHVDLAIRLEPLLFGVIPMSVLPVMYAILAILALGVPLSGFIHRKMQGIAEEVRREIEEKKVKKE